MPEWTRCAILLVLLSLPSCSRDSDIHGSQPSCGDVKTSASPIINGDPLWDPTVVTLTPEMADAVGFLELGGVGGCTGTLIAPRTVLTAAHCVYSRPSYVRFYVGDDFTAPRHVYTASTYVAHPYYGGRYVDYDLGMVVLETDPVDDGVVPIPVHLDPAQSLAGQWVQAVGYGMTRAGSYTNTRKWWTVLRVTYEIPTIFQVTGFDDNGTCQGDSGSPLLWNDPVLGTRVHGALSSGDSEDCLGNSFYPRTDTPDNSAFIMSYMPDDPCDGVTWEGYCEGNVAYWCEAYSIHSDTCDPWETCQPDGEGLSRCVVTDTCLGETWEGRCTDEGHAQWCEDGTILTHPCPDFGWWCGQGDDGLYRCQPPGPCEAESLSWYGICTTDGHARWCEDGQVKDRDCWLCGQDCADTGSTLGFYCVDRS